MEVTSFSQFKRFLSFLTLVGMSLVYGSCFEYNPQNTRCFLKSIAPSERWDYSDDVEEDLGGEFIEDDLTGTDLGGTDRGPDEQLLSVKTRKNGDQNCMTYNVSDSSERTVCTPGSQYVIRCRLCICPYMGNINNFCRPLPQKAFCEQAFPNFNYVPMGRRLSENATMNTTSHKYPKYPVQVHNPHNHTKYKCEEPGKLYDDCYICECEQDNMLVAEHCYKSDSEVCVNAKPTFMTVSDQDNFILKIIKLFI